MADTPLQRALVGAPEKSTRKVIAPQREFFVFLAGDLLLGVDSSTVREVTRLGQLTPLPRTASYVLGVCGHRGEVLPVLDLLRFFQRGELKYTPRTRIFIVQSQGNTAAVVTDLVLGLRKVPVSEVLPPPVSKEIPTEHVVGCVQNKDFSTTLTVLDMPRILLTARQRAVPRG